MSLNETSTSSFGPRAKALATIGILAIGLTLGACSSGSGGAAAGSGTVPSAEAPKETAPKDVSKAQSPAAPAPAPAEAKEPVVGKPFNADMRNGNTAHITIVSAKRAATLNSAFSAPPKNGSYLVLDVLWETEAGSTSSNPLYFAAKDANGRKADLNMFADGQLAAGDVLPGDKSRGLIVFDIGAGPATVTISDPLFQEAARIQIPG